MEKPIYELTLPPGHKLIKNDFHQYNPELEYDEEMHTYYLYEDLLQIEIEKLNMVIDLGWYSDGETDQGQFKIYVIRNFDWDNPVQEIVSKNSDEIYNKLLEVVNSLK